MEKQVLSKYVLAIVDFFFCFISAIISALLVYMLFDNVEMYIPFNQEKKG